MAHYQDLAPCDYFHDIGPLQAVGWLESGHDYAKGDPGQAFYDQLTQMLLHAWQPYFHMGWHACDFCRYNGFMSFKNLFIPGKDMTYVAPEAIGHYISAHGYAPPAEFIEALMQCPAMDTLAYFEALHARGWSKQVADYDQEKAFSEIVRNRRMATADGSALVGRIEAYWQANGTWPATLQETEYLAPDRSNWHYLRTDDSYLLRLVPRPDQTFLPMEWVRQNSQWRTGRPGMP